MVGKTLGHYEILEPLGAGGMGEVYRARDTKLNRDVAIKVLPPLLADDPERLARLQREAQLLAALNHPNIAAIYGLEDADEISFLAMELAEGQTLAQRLSDGAVGIDEALKIALQIAEALEAAHERGIVHRDLKPANIQVATEGSAAGQVKVLDFGLAKAFEADGTSQEMSPDLSHSPTMAAATRTGVIMGTAAYMSPEQARGKPVDKRTDIWAFGCVVFEMLTGKRAFQGETVTDILAAIVHQEPQWEALPPDTPLRIRDLLGRCLKKQADERLRDVGECRIAVKEYLADPEGEKRRALASAGTATAAANPWKLAVPLAVATLLIGVLGTWWATRPVPPAPEDLVRFDFELPEDVDFWNTGRHVVAVSPDGARIAFTGNNQLWLRRIDDLQATPLRGTGGPTSPFFSPDGQQLAFFSGPDAQIKRIAVTGGAPVSLAAAGNLYGASWAEDGMIYYGQGPGGIWRVSENGGEPENMISLDSGLSAHGPQLLPGGEWVLFTEAIGSGWNEGSIVAESLITGERVELIAGGTEGRWVPTGHIVYVRDGTLFAVPFDLGAMEVTSGPASMVEGVRTAASNVTGAANYAFTSRGGLVYVTGAANALTTRQLVWRDGDGNEELIADSVRPGRTWTPRLSPDGRYVAYRLDDDQGERNIWMLDLQRGVHSLFTPDGGARSFAWTPDGEWLYYSSDWDGDTDIYRRPADMRSPAEEFLGGDGNELVRSISPDGEWLLYADTDVLTTGAYDIEIVSLTEPGDPQPVFDRSIQEVTATFSPNGKWVAFVAVEEGARPEVYVQSFPNLGGITKISDGLGSEPLWAPDSRRLYYRSRRDLMVVDVVGEEPFDAGAPQLVLEDAFLRELGQNAGSYDISRNDQRLLMITAEAADDDEAPSGINVVLNWFEELKQRVPTGR